MKKREGNRKLLTARVIVGHGVHISCCDDCITVGISLPSNPSEITPEHLHDFLSMSSSPPLPPSLTPPCSAHTAPPEADSPVYNAGGKVSPSVPSFAQVGTQHTGVELMIAGLAASSRLLHLVRRSQQTFQGVLSGLIYLVEQTRLFPVEVRMERRQLYLPSRMPSLRLCCLLHSL